MTRFFVHCQTPEQRFTSSGETPGAVPHLDISSTDMTKDGVGCWTKTKNKCFPSCWIPRRER